METNTMQHWRLQQQGNIVWLGFDKKHSAVNTIDKNVLTELKTLLDVIEKDKSVHGLIITSHKSRSFILGADIQTISFLTNEKEIFDFIRQGQHVFKQLASLKISTVALINGFCLGGGLELALACRFRIAIDDRKTRLGLPEVKLGIHPGWGGTVRLPRLLGAINALQLMLTGRMISAKAACKIGLVDWVVPERHAIRAALYFANLRKRSNRLHWRGLSNFPWIRNGIAALFRRRLIATVNPTHYPAPFQILEQWRQCGVSDGAFLHEAQSLSQLAMTSTARNLIHVYFLRERLNKLGKKSLATLKHIHVIGAGTMGGDIAAWCALQGLYVTLQDREPKYLAPAIGRAHALFKKRLKQTRAVQMAMDRLLPDIAGSGIRRADLIIEAVFEDLSVKQNLFRQLETQIKSDAILATNTSSIVLEAIQQGLKQPERLIGLHFFNPVAKMPLVEVVQSELNAPDVVEKALAFIHQINRLPLPVKSSPGFLVNRLLMPYLLQAVLLLETGMPAAVIDRAAIDFGMPMGPLELADTVGLDICLAVAKILSQALQLPIPEGLQKMVANKCFGRKTGQGFYRYKKGKPIKEKIPDDYKVPADLVDRLIQPIIKEAKKCLQEKVVSDSDLLDAGMIFGTGFAPFRGGLLRYAKEKADNKSIVE
ncbi:MAG: 3-hydroxyacyl-CoA dehydrogenase NAD-binding domain-containing protein [Rickettsiella sp.]|nr:3-hydroxyacyl-CoA dehydrogenase NAD-binding domain-containing protein [Rickettsiella sp.]